MQKFTIEEARAACGGRYIKSGEGDIKSVVIDSRKAQPGALFVPLVGENTDGHNYIETAFSMGAVAALCQRDTAPDGGAVIGVENSSDAIGKIAYAYKQKYNVPTIGITGSVGKTTTKDMIAAVMAKKYCCLKTEGNFNNELGLPLTVFRLEKEHTAAVLEMGMSAFGEIHHLVDIARPEVGVITNIGMSHIENLGSREGILKAKLEICDFFDTGSLLVINGDDDMLKNVVDDGYEIIRYGINGENLQLRGYDIEDYGINGSKFRLDIDSKQYEIRINSAGVHNVYNALAAIAVGRHYNIPMSEIIAALGEFELTAMRMTVEKYGGLTLINDCYNASPDSIRASLAVLKKSESRRVAVLGDVLELGEYAKDAHMNIGRMCADTADVLICAGENAKYIAETAKAVIDEVYYFPTTADAAAFAAEFCAEGDTVLVKASRGMHFEQICNAIGDKMK